MEGNNLDPHFVVCIPTPLKITAVLPLLPQRWYEVAPLMLFNREKSEVGPEERSVAQHYLGRSRKKTLRRARRKILPKTASSWGEIWEIRD